MGSEIKDFTDLVVWQKAYALALAVCRLTGTFPQEEKFGLVVQLRRCSISVPSNIAEGWGRGSSADYGRFLRIARGSLLELQTQVWLARDLGYVHAEHNVLNDIVEVKRLLAGLIKSIH